MPEVQDSDFSWEKFVHRNNDELVATYGNLAHRMLTFSKRHFEGRVPEPGELDDVSLQLLADADGTLAEVSDALSRCSFREALRASMALAQKANRYLDEKAPWKVIKESKEEAGRSVYTVLCVLSVLSTALYPFLPFSSEKLHSSLGFSDSVLSRGWKGVRPEAGQALGDVQHLFVKLDEAVIEEEEARLGT